MFDILVEILGFLVLAAAFLLLGYALVAFRRPNPPAWTDGFMVIEGIGVLLTAMFAVGIGLLVDFTMQFAGAQRYMAGIASIVGLAVVFKLVWWALGVKRTLAAHDSAVRQ